MTLSKYNSLSQAKKLPAVLATALALTLVACGGEASHSPTVEPNDAPPLRVEVATAQLESVAVQTRASGSVAAFRRVSPGTKILGPVAEVAVREGDRVERGQLLARLESRDLEAAVAQAEAARGMAEAQLENARTQHERMQGLHGRGSVTDKNLEDATTAFRVATAQVAQAEANLAAARVTLGYARITSPLTGWVVARRIEAGDMATPGAPLFTVEDLSRVKVEVDVPEAEMDGLEPGTPARVDLLGRVFDTSIDRIVPAADPASRTFKVQLVLDNPEGTLRSGLFARVTFESGNRRYLLRVPPSAVVVRGQLEGLFTVDDDGRARLRWIQTGQAVDDRVEVLSGLEPGAPYLVSPPPGLQEGRRLETTDGGTAP